ncbi:hypothetical protein DK880_00625 [Candidatus Cardinium hertigii]|uniref:Uncharacterized protein n=1 Tax=Candidatus Cardinium hertigii TaxID=247481 RepID=A0A2Z3L986_9BACT|nr:hypothetical protein DK880_00625 [Candidatus Cardinium hertigii]
MLRSLNAFIRKGRIAYYFWGISLFLSVLIIKQIQQTNLFTYGSILGQSSLY